MNRYKNIYINTSSTVLRVFNTGKFYLSSVFTLKPGIDVVTAVVFEAEVYAIQERFSSCIDPA